MTATPPPGWYPDPSGDNNQRYFDGTNWTDHVAPIAPRIPPPGPGDAPNRQPSARKSLRPFLIMAIGGPPTAIVTFILMQLAFGAANRGGSGTLIFQISGFVLFLLWLASAVATIVGVVGAIVRSVRQQH
ncbi:DUF2510 domain-containing protein [Mycobacterium sp. E3198]|uniref:DUF2510 domain-containing protein n=1 Tax=Mycobacterium sp. E3198 TaxID=1834143 RepID=UPI0007FF6F78|nr:DUF2510 domain-containing protein [Mycobacterium sp. E3198]OBG25435.1 hypothetical protein A5673_09120 [Mycobacterium sp. E3198]